MWKVKKLNKFIKQTGIKDCGVCCIYNILKLNNEDISLEKLRDKTKTDKNGTPVLRSLSGDRPQFRR